MGGGWIDGRHQAITALLLLVMLLAACSTRDVQFEQDCERRGIGADDPNFEACVAEGRAKWEQRMRYSFPSGRNAGP